MDPLVEKQDYLIEMIPEPKDQEAFANFLSNKNSSVNVSDYSLTELKSLVSEFRESTSGSWSLSGFLSGGIDANPLAALASTAAETLKKNYNEKMEERKRLEEQKLIEE